MKGIILAAGYGTRFLPITKTIPKEMLPLGTRPALDYVVQEFIDAGIRDILIIGSRRKKVLEDYFDREAELEAVFTRENKTANLRKIAPPDAQIYFVRQQAMEGTGAAVMLAREFAGADPCVLAFPDDIHFGEVSLAKQLADVHARTGSSVLALDERPAGEDISRYGVAAVAEGSDPLNVTGLVEKPPTGEEPSRYISIGRYLITPEVFDALAEERRTHQGGEFYLTSAFNRLAGEGKLSGCAYTGERLDTGEPQGYYQALVRYILQDPEQGPEFRDFLLGVLRQ
ncbi:MAG TPA: UTP--glucose-1-phosphate uridylyltransferase [Armatimonadota bacterium]|nr:UTP--glucose-1-phosphate uridylyltransferase [Armatimonadota bacterium]